MGQAGWLGGGVFFRGGGYEAFNFTGAVQQTQLVKVFIEQTKTNFFIHNQGGLHRGGQGGAPPT